jgi:hypothetical protein
LATSHEALVWTGRKVSVPVAATYVAAALMETEPVVGMRYSRSVFSSGWRRTE